MNRKFLLGILAVVFLAGFISAYTYSTSSSSLFNNAGGVGSFASYSQGKIDAELCSAGTDFILQIDPFSCEPAPVRSDLLEEEDVTVYCKISATQINPLIDVESIKTIYISGTYPSEVKSVGYFPSQSALGYTSENVLGDVALNNMGYVAITLRHNANESSMPDYVEGDLTARIKYDVENAFGVGNAEFSLPVLSDNEYNNKINQYSFWEGRGYLRVESVGNDNAMISIYSDVNSVGTSSVDKQRVSRLTLEEGQTSGEIFLPGFSPCLASLKVRLNGFEDPDTTAKLKINSDYVEVADGESFLDEKCHVLSIKKDGLNQRVSILCKEDGDNSRFELVVSPSVKLKIGDADVKDYVIGDYLYTSSDNAKSVYLGYIGSKGDTEDIEDLYIVLIAVPEYKVKLSEDEISSIATRMNLLFSDVKTGAGILDVSASVLGKFAGGFLTGLKWAVEGDDIHVIDLKSSSGIISAREDFKGQKVSLAGFSESQDSNFLSIKEETYTLKKTSDSDENKYKILKGGEDTGLYLLESSSGSPRMILSMDSGTVLGRITLGSFYGEDCDSHVCFQYLLSNKNLVSTTSYSWFFENLIYGEADVDDGYILLKRVSFDAISDEDYYENYEKAITDFETVLNSFSGEEYSLETTYGEEALYEAILLSERLGQRKTMKDFCQEFEENYPDSYKPMDICENVYRNSNTEVSSREVLINGKIKEITFAGIYEPSYEEYGAEVLVRGPNGKVQTYQLRKDKIVYLEGFRDTDSSSDQTESIRLRSVDEDSIRIEVSTIGESTLNKLLVSNTYTLEEGATESFGTSYFFMLEDINLEQNAKVSIIPSFNYQESNTTFSYKIGIEKRIIQLSDDQIKNRINTLNNSIESLTKISNGLNTFNDALGKACLATGAILTLKNFIENSDGKSIARKRVMQGSGGWNEFCQKEVAKDNSQYVSLDDCFFENSEKIDAQVDEVYNVIREQDENINAIQSATPKTSLNTIDEDEFMKKYSVQGVNSLTGIGDSNGEFIAEGRTEKLNIEKLQEDILDYDGWRAGNYNVDDLREIELYATLIKTTTNSENKEAYSQKLYSLLYDVSVNSETAVKRDSLTDKYGVNVDLLEAEGKDVVKRAYLGGTYGELPAEFRLKVAGYSSDAPVQVIYTSDGDEFVIFLEDKGESILPVKKNEDGQKLIYDENGNLVPEKQLPTEFKKIYFQKYDEKTYENKYLNPEVRYYEEEPYDGNPAVVPLDTTKGWYAGVKPKLDVGSSIAAYDESGRVNSFWLCNVGENGLEEFSKDSFGDDICQQINIGVSGSVYNQFYGLSESETTKLVVEAVGTTGTQGAIEEAQRAYRNGARRVRINGVNYEVGEPAIEIPAVSCTDYMSPTDCQILFNVCDPVVCPSSRCDFGGNYPVKDVVQSGVIGSIALCAPNAREGIAVPVCTTGIQAGLDSWLSVEEAYRDCLQENLETGTTVGICDEIHSVYACEFFWRQGIPLAKVAIPKALSAIAGEGVRGGGEYLGLQSSWDNARDSLSYFTQYYAAESYNAFKLRSVDEAGGEVCKNFASIVYPNGGELLDSLTAPRSPPQFSGNFDEIELTTITNPPTSQYKVYYHIYAGTDSGAYYQVYLTGGSTSSYYQDTSVRRVVDSGYIVAGDYADEAIDFQAPSGYVTMCIVVNGQEECGFSKVSTSFAVNYVNDLYLAEQSTTKVTTEAECVSGTASLYSLLNPNAESIVDELIDPALYQKGIIRVCATNNPGQGTDGAIGTEDQRWRDVGYCGDTNVRCWLDTDSVKDAIEALNIEKGVLNETAQNVINSLIASGDYINNQNYSNTISNIKSETDSVKKISLINGILDRVFFSSQKAELYFLRGLAYGSLARDEYAKVEKFQSDYFYDTAVALGEEDVRESYFVLSVGGEFSFDFKGETYVVKVLEVENLRAKVSISVISKEQSFALGDRVFFNLDSDSEYDLALTLSDIENGKAKFLIEVYYSVGEVDVSSLDSLAQKIATYEGYFVNEVQSCSIHTKDSGIPYYSTANCYNSVTLIYDKVGVSRPNCIYSAQSGAELPSGIKVDDESDTFTHDCGTTGRLTEDQKLNFLAPGYQFDAVIPYNGDKHGSPNYAVHSLIFLSWKDKDKKIANVFDWNGATYEIGKSNTKGEKCQGEFIHTFSSGAQRCKTYRVYELDLSDTDNYVYLIRGYSSDFVFGDSKVSTSDINVAKSYLENLFNQGKISDDISIFVRELRDTGILTNNEANFMLGNDENNLATFKEDAEYLIEFLEFKIGISSLCTNTESPQCYLDYLKGMGDTERYTTFIENRILTDYVYLHEIITEDQYKSMLPSASGTLLYRVGTRFNGNPEKGGTMAELREMLKENLKNFSGDKIRESVLNSARSLNDHEISISQVYENVGIDIFDNKCVYISDSSECSSCNGCSRDEGDLRIGDLVLLYDSKTDKSFYIVFRKFSEEDDNLISGWIVEDYFDFSSEDVDFSKLFSVKNRFYYVEDVFDLSGRNAVSMILDPTKN